MHTYFLKLYLLTLVIEMKKVHVNKSGRGIIKLHFNYSNKFHTHKVGYSSPPFFLLVRGVEEKRVLSVIK